MFEVRHNDREANRTNLNNKQGGASPHNTKQMKDQIRSAIKEQFGMHRKFCAHAGYPEKDFPKKLINFDKSIKRLNKLLIHLWLELGLKEIHK